MHNKNNKAFNKSVNIGRDIVWILSEKLLLPNMNTFIWLIPVYHYRSYILLITILDFFKCKAW